MSNLLCTKWLSSKILKFTNFKLNSLPLDFFLFRLLKCDHIESKKKNAIGSDYTCLILSDWFSNVFNILLNDFYFYL